MRAFFIVLLLVLTPLRGWAADSMAIQMALQSPLSTGATPVHCPDMPTHATGTPAPTSPDETGHSEPCGHCAFCQLCATVGLVAPVMAMSPGAFAHHRPWARRPTFTSANTWPDHKPPIA